MAAPAPASSFATRLAAAVDRRGGAACVGLDPVLEKVPHRNGGDPVAAIEAFSLRVVEAVAGLVPAVKLQMACFERYGSRGVAAAERVLGAAGEAELLTIADAKRGDIGVSAAHYAAAFTAGPLAADAVTVSPYLGFDTLVPFREAAAAAGTGVFVLVRTSNPGGDDLQSLRTPGGGVAEVVAAGIERMNGGLQAGEAYGPVGAVVGATRPAVAEALRVRMPRSILLVPGIGAQGGDPAALSALFDARGHGALLTASRSVIYAEDPAEGARRLVAAAAQAADRG
ncbi:orotidine-5'-phosphate decarboxylase [Phycisphaera mikurensis]|uniref:Orotidine 5'-phosphate decarboxylase n=1 Tax=Phycisphaera mikurensis (strain NBRC 102666 / KCTC 22515 / FYK2301M01) TaxID=1142394 RepID=I0IDR1_PHYMF|nr:orotidine-5'-phosphate decarboxylase [Phycisphaera mikurensis]MBB6441214.1 orotidine-5'-phosphate decarboxylase [Phycisphaera mikurensis]BAM03399.1 orotidine 5'-phosphate decarboxylase [Phycisphaera mikurensis NBRC 102666]